MSGIFSSVIRAIDRLSDICMIIGEVLILLLPLIMSYEVASRYFFKKPTVWAIDFSNYIVLTTTFFAAGWLLRKNEHVRLNFFLDRSTPTTRFMMGIAQSFMGIFGSGFLLWSGIKATWDALVEGVQIVGPLTYPKFIVLWVIPFGALMLLIYFVQNLFTSLTALKSKDAALAEEARREADEALQKPTL